MNLTTSICFLLIFFKHGLSWAPISINLWAIWNVGQGQWVTHIQPLSCTHFDMGGEFNSFSKIKKTLIALCAHKKNYLNVTHWDYDHVLNISNYAKTIPDLCWQTQPSITKENKFVLKILNLHLPSCSKKSQQHPEDKPFHFWIPFVAKDSNESSVVFWTADLLISGDSPMRQEKNWIHEISNSNKIRFLVLGHHGSQSSTSYDLLIYLKNLKMAVASARFAKYGHPHKKTVLKLRHTNVSLLKTEDWGNIMIEP